MSHCICRECGTSWDDDREYGPARPPGCSYCDPDRLELKARINALEFALREAASTLELYDRELTELEAGTNENGYRINKTGFCQGVVFKEAGPRARAALKPNEEST